MQLPISNEDPDAYDDMLFDRLVARYRLSVSELLFQPTMGVSQTIALDSVARVRLTVFGDVAECALVSASGARYVISIYVADRRRDAARIAAYNRFVVRLHQLIAIAAPRAELRAGGWLRTVVAVAAGLAGVVATGWAGRPILAMLCAASVPIAIWTQRPRRYSPLAIPPSCLP